MKSKKLGLVTVLYNAPSVLDDFLYSISRQNYKDYHLYVVDNSTTPESIVHAKTLTDLYNIPVTYIDNKGNNVGVAAGNNQGIKAALADDCELLLIINNDLIFTSEDTFSNTAALIDVSNNVNMVSPLILSYPEKSLWYCGGYIDKLRAVAPHIDAGKDLIDAEKYSGLYSYAPTCFLVVHRAIFNDVGLMDENYFAYYDDTDFLYRCNKKSYKVFLDASSVIYHKVSSSTGGGLSYFGVYYLTRNRIIFSFKNLSFPYLQISVFYSVITRLVKIAMSKGNVRRAYLDGLVAGFRDRNK
jgi:hypothetical protein